MSEKTEMQQNSIEAALLALSSVDQDYASIQNGIGFNGRDTGFGNSLANQILSGRTLSPKQAQSAYKMLRTYKNQLLNNFGIDYEQIPDPATVASTTRRKDIPKTVDFANGEFIFEFPYDAATKDALKAMVPGHWWDSVKKVWTAPAASSVEVAKFAVTYGFAPTDEAMEVIKRLPTVKSEPIPFGRLIVNEDGTMAEVVFPGYPGSDVLHDIKAIPGRRYDADTKIWSVPLGSASVNSVKALMEKWELAVTGEERIAETERKILANIEDSHALDADIQIDGLGLELRPFQKAGVQYTLNNLAPGKGVYIADEMGLGKSPESLAVLQKKDAFPALVVVPKVVWLNWAKEVKKWLPGRTVALLTGKNVNKNTVKAVESLGAQVVTLGTDLPEVDIYVVNYDILAKWAEPVGKRVGNGVKYTATGALSNIEWQAVIFDEAHLLKERKSKRTHAANSMVNTREVPVVLCLSGTPIPNRPAELIVPIKDILHRLDEVGGWKTLWFHHCNGDSKGARDLDGLNTKMRSSFYVRRVKGDVLPELPPVQWTPVTVEMTDPQHYWDVEADIAVWLKDKLEKDAEFQKAIEHLDEETQVVVTEQTAVAKSMRYRGVAEILVKMNALRMVAAREKLEATIEWLEEWLEDTRTNGSGSKIIVFGIHRDINEMMSQHFNAPLIYGGMDAATRNDAEEKFQNDPNTRVLVCSIDAAGVGLTLTAASHVAFIETPWRPMDLDQAVGRAYGRLSDLHGVTAYVISAPGTIEDRILNLINEKRVVTDAGQDGSVATQVLRDLIKSS